MPNLPPLASLRAFECAARHLSFRAAADELAVTQSAISHQVAELERRLGVKLFHRHSRRVELTAAGAQYQPYLREAFDRIAQGTALVRAAAPGRELDVQVYVTVAVRWLIPRLHSFTTAHPDIRVRFNTSHLDWEFDEAAGDVAIVCTDQPHRPGLHATHLFDAHLTPVCSPSLVHGGIGLRQPADLVNHSLLQLFTAADEWSVWLQAAGVPVGIGRSALRFDSYLLALEAASDGQGVAIVPRFLAAGDLRGGRLVAPFALQVPQPRHWYLVCRADRRGEPGISAFREWLRAEVADDADITGG
ncbi:MAG: transcriptional regulator GcvA [Actinomycetota bacterium]|nr:transcriptional regulator GcvA [Actinomycetota bacterium]